jgi:hypothetical protein
MGKLFQKKVFFSLNKQAATAELNKCVCYIQDRDPLFLRFAFDQQELRKEVQPRTRTEGTADPYLRYSSIKIRKKVQISRT